MNIRLLSQTDIKQCVTMKDAIEAMRRAFLEMATGHVIQPLRGVIPIASKHAATLTMPAYLSQSKQLGVKIVSAFPENAQINQPSIHGAIILLDANTGIPIAFLEASYLTALRTGAIAGLATDLLASKSAKTLCMIGAGAQASTIIEAITSVRPIEKIHIWSRQGSHAATFVDKFRDRFPMIKASETIQDALKGADIVCTATPATSSLFQIRDIKPDAFLCAIGSHSRSMQEIGLDIMAKAQIFVDQKEAALRESGEIITAFESQCIQEKEIIEIGTLLTNSDYSLSKGLIVFKSVGLAIQDISIAHLAYDNACVQGLGLNHDFS